MATGCGERDLYSARAFICHICPMVVVVVFFGVLKSDEVLQGDSSCSCPIDDVDDDAHIGL